MDREHRRARARAGRAARGGTPGRSSSPRRRTRRGRAGTGRSPSSRAPRGRAEPARASARASRSSRCRSHGRATRSGRVDGVRERIVRLHCGELELPLGPRREVRSCVGAGRASACRHRAPTRGRRTRCRRYAGRLPRAGEVPEAGREHPAACPRRSTTRAGTRRAGAWRPRRLQIELARRRHAQQHAARRVAGRGTGTPRRASATRSPRCAVAG